jgi:hypothetical protein
MVEWVNNGSIRDISSLAKDSLAVTSQHGGNQVWSSANAHTAPGGASGNLGDGVGDAVVVPPPVIEEQPQIAPGTDGKPKARNSTSYSPGKPDWGKTTVPETVREE